MIAQAREAARVIGADTSQLSTKRHLPMPGRANIGVSNRFTRSRAQPAFKTRLWCLRRLMRIKLLDKSGRLVDDGSSCDSSISTMRRTSGSLPYRDCAWSSSQSLCGTRWRLQQFRIKLFSSPVIQSEQPPDRVCLYDTRDRLLWRRGVGHRKYSGA